MLGRLASRKIAWNTLANIMHNLLNCTKIKDLSLVFLARKTKGKLNFNSFFIHLSMFLIQTLWFESLKLKKFQATAMAKRAHFLAQRDSKIKANHCGRRLSFRSPRCIYCQIAVSDERQPGSLCNVLPMKNHLTIGSYWFVIAFFSVSRLVLREHSLKWLDSFRFSTLNLVALLGVHLRGGGQTRLPLLTLERHTILQHTSFLLGNLTFQLFVCWLVGEHVCCFSLVINSPFESHTATNKVPNSVSGEKILHV